MLEDKDIAVYEKMPIISTDLNEEKEKMIGADANQLTDEEAVQVLKALLIVKNIGSIDTRTKRAEDIEKIKSILINSFN